MAGAVLAGCGGNADSGAVASVIEQAQKMDEAELYRKAAEEIKDKTFVVIANSSRMKDAFPAWVEYVKKTYKMEDFKAGFSTTQPKNNQIFNQIQGDVKGANHNISMTLIQDGSQIKAKMTKPGYLLNYIPKEWGGNRANDGEPLALQSLSKVFAYNSIGVEAGGFDNVFDFVLKDDGSKFSTQFMSINSEPVGQNMFFMLTRKDYADVVKAAYDAATAKQKEVVDGVLKNKDSGIDVVVSELNLSENAKYSLAWIYLFQKNFTKVEDDGPICKNICRTSSAGAAGLLVYSKFRSIAETAESSVKQMKVAAYENGYTGFGGYMYKHYLQVLKTSPFPWTSCAFIHFMTTHKEGFQPWGKDIGGYSSNPAVQSQFDHSNDGGTEFPVKNDKGFAWWSANEAGKGRLIIEDGEYCTNVSSTMTEWFSHL